MDRLSFNELADMHLMYGLAQGNAAEARRLYIQSFPNRDVPGKESFRNVDRNLREFGTLKKRTSEGRPRVDGVTEEEVLEQFERNPATSVRTVSDEIGVPKSTIWNILSRNSMYPYHVQRVQGLSVADYGPRLQFCQWVVNRIDENPNFCENILFTDEAGFDRNGIFNYHNLHVWALENPKAIDQRRHQQQLSCTVWAGIIGDELIGPYFFEERLNGQNYVGFLREELGPFLENVPLIIRQNMWFMHDGAPAHFSRVARDHLNRNYGQRWIGRGGPVAWPPRSPDINPLDFYLWGHVKSIVYRNAPNNIADLRQRIIHGFEEIRRD
ncbi:transposable element tc3 transposase, partial [Lasius niger]